MLGTRIAAALAGRGVRVVQWIQDIYPEVVAAHYGEFAGWLLSSWRRQRDQAWRASAACITLGTDMAAAVAATGVPAKRIALIPNWAPRELHAAPPASAVAALREQWQVRGRFVVTYSGNLGRVHEFTTVLDAIAALQDNPNVVFHVIGRGPRLAAVAEAVGARGLRQVAFHPPVSRAELPILLAAADAHLVTLQPAFGQLVYPSKLAGILAAGRPTLFVGSPGGEIAQFLRQHDCGAAFAPGEAGALAATIAAWAADRSAAGGLGRNAHLAYAEHFTLDAALAQWDARLRGLDERA
jgi:glycosyltransferase involved in cell wall biosynthesis